MVAHGFIVPLDGMAVNVLRAEDHLMVRLKAEEVGVLVVLSKDNAIHHELLLIPANAEEVLGGIERGVNLPLNLSKDCRLPETIQGNHLLKNHHLVGTTGIVPLAVDDEKQLVDVDGVEGKGVHVGILPRIWVAVNHSCVVVGDFMCVCNIELAVRPRPTPTLVILANDFHEGVVLDHWCNRREQNLFVANLGLSRDDVQTITIELVAPTLKELVQVLIADGFTSGFGVNPRVPMLGLLPLRVTSTIAVLGNLFVTHHMIHDLPKLWKILRWDAELAVANANVVAHRCSNCTSWVRACQDASAQYTLPFASKMAKSAE